ncbi:FliM/FliN family flagellar motor switch protein [Ketobacter alkanivorans]|uniref:Flagellar motor switch protein FliN n=1 Tax=Ketobacter alkanivorans TaxID=1917421 RepID=A0A2K9LL18_9GAMM|nr:FliM/FliN family flagellar motor switch protein [Ketobacter alkanivorans]AUM12953.1 hypothetical protein Kalk_11185 [Ketobacter alkanivorans]
MTQKSVSVEGVELSPFEEAREGRSLVENKLDLVGDVKVRLAVELGEIDLTVNDLFSLKENSLVGLDAPINSDLKLMMNGKCVAIGSLMVVGDNFGIQITKVFTK